MSPWLRKPDLEELNRDNAETMVGHLGIEFVEAGDNHLKATMPVDRRTVQPHDILHGGASVALAETLGSVAANLAVDETRSVCLGMEINANHVRSVRSGKVTGITRPVHIGKSSHVWQIDIHDETGRLVCVSRLTLAVIERRSGERQP